MLIALATMIYTMHAHTKSLISWSSKSNKELNDGIWTENATAHKVEVMISLKIFKFEERVYHLIDSRNQQK